MLIDHPGAYIPHPIHINLTRTRVPTNFPVPMYHALLLFRTHLPHIPIIPVTYPPIFRGPPVFKNLGTRVPTNKHIVRARVNDGALGIESMTLGISRNDD